MAPKKSSAQKAAEAAARKAAADAAAVNNLSLEEVQALLASKQQAAAAAAKAAADKAAADQAAADKAAAEAAAPAGTGATPSPGDLTPSLLQLIASSVAAAVATEFAKRDATPAGTTAEDRPTNTSAVAKPGLTAEEQAVEHLGGALGQGAAAGESFLAKAQREKAAAAKQVREANEKLRLATLIADGAANLGGTGTVDRSAAPAGQGFDFPANLGAAAAAGRGTGRGFNFSQADSDVGRLGAGGGLPGGGGGGSSSGGASGPSSEAARLALAEGSTTVPVESTTGSLEHATHPYQTRFTQLEIAQQQKVTALKEQWFSHNSEKLLSVAATKTLGELQRVLISMEMNETSLQDSIALLRTKRGTQGAVERLQVVLKSTQLDVAYLSSKVLTLEGFIHVYNMADDTDDPEACKQHFSKKWALVNKDPKQILEVVKSFTDGAVFGKMVEDALRNGRSSSGDNKRTPRAAGLDAPGGVGEITSGAGNSTSPAPGGSKKNVRFKGGKGGKGRKSGN